ncbi:amino acid ABC transporter permease [Faecalicoccus pleomorphus]|uniref:amino acid ABC transporter permease n=1 Tax=Faecalicoccus pleomorphus TaxID=1323 RepID=UPI00143072EB|nr:amino acid ABC transporter permease [Faecalicoccus pleomorphus]MBM6678687.1 amino acid ABC transporter permease [Faecalicoccus pleomorphus]MBM6765880.1 amino acid ABC transporter permease [Faecalicoccus pleomorphus]MBM6808872.1 amino acid ABC transporter permease [Faecalicoccus pleomorphus]MDB7987508.1 amino acid ABC transporter permease [Faecalicoccus pleomorphus]MDB7992032.1 amino acid ABC transporter permease [Faecalicoccus pleomorphus]
MSIDFGRAYEIFIENWSLFSYGIQNTLLFAIVGTVVGLILGLITGALRAIPEDPMDSLPVKILKKLARWIVGFYVWFFRGTPMMVQALFFFYLLRPILGWTGFSAGLIIISVNTGAYMAEIIRGGIQSIDAGQSEAAKSLGMTTFQTMVSIIFPQAIKNTFPTIGNQLIVNIKDSCMLNAIQVTELYFQSSSVAGSNMKFAEVYFLEMVMYLALTTIATLILNAVERKINKTKTVTIKENCA